MQVDRSPRHLGGSAAVDVPMTLGESQLSFPRTVSRPEGLSLQNAGSSRGKADLASLHLV